MPGSQHNVQAFYEPHAMSLNTSEFSHSLSKLDLSILKYILYSKVE